MWGGVWDRVWASSGHGEITLDSAVRGYHVYKVVWKQKTSGRSGAWQWSRQICHESCQKQRNSRPFTSRVLANFVVIYSHVAERYAWKWVDVTANSCVEEWRFLLGWCLFVRVKWKLIAWKNSWRARFADRHVKTQTAPLGATNHEKVNEQQQHTLSFF